MAGTLAQAEAAKVNTRAGGPPSTQMDEQPAMAILRQYFPQLKAMLPGHIVPEAWYAGAFAALFRNPELLNAANRNPESLMFALMDAARWGLEPGTKQFWLTPRPNRKAKAGVEVLGIMGYVGIIELIFRAGAVENVVVEVVRENDEFSYRPGRDPIPNHEIDWMKSRQERGALVLAYAYAKMVTGGWSRPVILTRDDIARAKSASATASSSYSPWKTDEEAMWKKTAARRLENWVPTSATYVQAHQATMIAAAQARETAKLAPAPVMAALPPGQQPMPPLGHPDANAASPLGSFAPTGFAPALDGGDPADEGTDEPTFIEGAEAPDGEHVDGGGFEPANQTQHRKIMAMLGKRVKDDAHRHALFSALLDRTITSQGQVSTTEADEVYEILKGWGKSGSLDREVAALAPGSQPAAAPVATAELPKPGTPEWHADRHPMPTDGGQVNRVQTLLNGDCALCEDDR